MAAAVPVVGLVGAFSAGVAAGAGAALNPAAGAFSEASGNIFRAASKAVSDAFDEVANAAEAVMDYLRKLCREVKNAAKRRTMAPGAPPQVGTSIPAVAKSSIAVIAAAAAVGLEAFTSSMHGGTAGFNLSKGSACSYLWYG
ncbi:hypothetical protein ACP70R_012214 [Stipagrostis hirtigluma subsp. patula]